VDQNARGRLAYLDATEKLLWPTADALPPPANGMCILPSPTKPRLLAPVSPRRAASSAVLRYSAQQNWLGRSAGIGLAVAVRLGYLGRASRRRPGHALGPDSIDAHLGQVMGEPVSTSLSLSPDRANRKPVLQVFDRAGRTIAFAKVGVNDLSDQLVRNEAMALGELAASGLSTITVARVVSSTTWRNMPVLVMSVLPALSLHRVSDALVDRAMLEISAMGAEAAGPAPLARYLNRLNARADAAANGPGREFVAPWRELFDAVVADPATADVRWGSWHGDWTTWNCVPLGDRLAVWDWERFDHGVPIGFDRLHFVLNRKVGRSRSGFATEAPALIAAAGDLLRPWRVAPSTARVIALLYILDIALRYLSDDQRASGGGGTVEQWAFPAVQAALATANAQTREPRP
jgi:Phosphotransferase enzyme family